MAEERGGAEGGREEDLRRRDEGIRGVLPLRVTNAASSAPCASGAARSALAALLARCELPECAEGDGEGGDDAVDVTLAAAADLFE